MKIRFLLFYFLFICFALTSCSDKNKPDYPEDQTTTRWIEQTMRLKYLWYKKIPDAEKLNFNLSPKDFFSSLLWKEDGKTRNGTHYYYSTIVDLSEGKARSLRQTEYSYGFDFTVYIDRNNNGFAHVLYVVPNSPASEAGIKRGDWIIQVNGKNLTNTNYTVLFGDEACELTVGYWDAAIQNIRLYPTDIHLSAARPVEDDPVHYYDTIHHAGKKIGYLVYNHFTDGKKEGDKSYDNKLRQISNQFKQDGIEEFILDLRYNNGGLLSSAQILCSILAPESTLGKSLGYMEFNDNNPKKIPEREDIPVNRSHLGTGSNLNLSTVYILVTSSSASASEMVINSLDPYMKVVTIGTKTEGKNVGSRSYKSKDNLWELHPIICSICNSEGYGDYSNGIMPKHVVDETSWTENRDWSDFLPLGDKDELLLKTALNLIENPATPSSAEPRADSEVKQLLFNSIERRSTNGVIIE